MYRSLTRLPLGFAGVSSLSRRRALTYASKHRAFPTTLYLTRVQLERKSELYDLAFNKPEWAYSDGMEVPKDGLVHPTINNRVCNGALLISNTHSMHELTDNAVTYYVDCLSSGQAPATEPHFLCIPKGDPSFIPRPLTGTNFSTKGPLSRNP
ncbi:hypothetical protein N7445_008648 [Penicillium cf. griseofulvum]|nr:hypothetical protein N7445_008648 [Penicillium cf. griseofulvum]